MRGRKILGAVFFLCCAGLSTVRSVEKPIEGEPIEWLAWWDQWRRLPHCPYGGRSPEQRAPLWITVRPMKPCDGPRLGVLSLQSISKHTYKNVLPHPLDKIQNVLLYQQNHDLPMPRPGHQTFVAINHLHGSKIVGYCHAGPKRLDISGFELLSLGEIHAIYVAQRSQGIGDLLLRSGLRYLTRQGWTPIVVGVRLPNRTAMKFYLRPHAALGGAGPWSALRMIWRWRPFSDEKHYYARQYAFFFNPWEIPR